MLYYTNANWQLQYQLLKPILQIMQIWGARKTRGAHIYIYIVRFIVGWQRGTSQRWAWVELLNYDVLWWRYWSDLPRMIPILAEIPIFQSTKVTHTLPTWNICFWMSWESQLLIGLCKVNNNILKKWMKITLRDWWKTIFGFWMSQTHGLPPWILTFEAGNKFSKAHHFGINLICSMHGMFTCISHKFMLNVGKYSLHGACG